MKIKNKKTIIDSLFSQQIRRLNHVKRFSSHPIIRTENVAEHSFWVSYTAYMLSLDLKNNGIKINPLIVLEKALLHDLEESQTGDVVRDFKYENPEILKQIKETEKKLFGNILETQFNKEIKNEIYEKWMKCKDDSIEGRLLALCDILCVLIYCVEEIRLGNNFMRDILNDASQHLENFKKNKDLGPYVLDIEKYLKKFKKGE